MPPTAVDACLLSLAAGLCTMIGAAVILLIKKTRKNISWRALHINLLLHTNSMYLTQTRELLFTRGDVVTIMIQTLEHVNKVQKQMMRMFF